MTMQEIKTPLPVAPPPDNAAPQANMNRERTSQSAARRACGSAWSGWWRGSRTSGRETPRKTRESRAAGSPASGSASPTRARPWGKKKGGERPNTSAQNGNVSKAIARREYNPEPTRTPSEQVNLEFLNQSLKNRKQKTANSKLQKTGTENRTKPECSPKCQRTGWPGARHVACPCNG